MNEEKSEQSRKTKIRLNIRLWNTTKERLVIAAEKLGVSETAVIEMALREKFAKDDDEQPKRKIKERRRGSGFYNTKTKISKEKFFDGQVDHRLD
jgi:hypothetical protein